MTAMSIETSLKDIQVYREDGPPRKRKGHVDVRVRLLREGLDDAEELFDGVVAINIVRVYFSTEDVTVRELIDSAFHQARRAIRQTGEQCGSALLNADPEQLWIE